MTTSASSTSRAMTTGSSRSRTACSRRLRLMPWGRTRSVGRGEPPGTSTVSPSGALLGAERQPIEVVVASSSSALTGPVPSSALSVWRACAAWSRHAFWRSSSRASRARVSAAVGAAPRSSGPRSAMSPATNGASSAGRRARGRRTAHPGIVPGAPPSETGPRGALSRPDPPRVWRQPPDAPGR